MEDNGGVPKCGVVRRSDVLTLIPDFPDKQANSEFTKRFSRFLTCSTGFGTYMCCKHHNNGRQTGYFF